jgi:hypothetical protein
VKHSPAVPRIHVGRLAHGVCLSRRECWQRTNEEDERHYRWIEDWFARKEKLFWTEEASDGTWEAYVASGHMMERSQAVGPCMRGGGDAS